MAEDLLQNTILCLSFRRPGCRFDLVKSIIGLVTWEEGRAPFIKEQMLVDRAQNNSWTLDCTAPLAACEEVVVSLPLQAFLKA